METYELKINTKEFLGMLSNYFTLKLEKPIQVKEKHNIGYEGIYEDRVVNVEIYYEEQIEILGHTATKTTTLDKDEIKAILNELIDNENYTITSFNYNTNIETKGYCRDEYEEAVFKGVTINVKEKQKQLRK